MLINKVFGWSARKSACLIVLLMYSATAFSFDFDREIVLKSGFIYNFARLSEGNILQANSNHYFICSQDDDFLTVSSKIFEGKEVKGLSVATKKVTSINAVEGCNVLFVSKKHFLAWKAVLQSEALKKTMIIGEEKGFIQSGGHVNFFLLSGKIRFEISLLNLERSGIKLSSKVLRLGKVHGESGHE